MARSAARSTVALGIGFVLAGAAFDSESLYVPGIALTLLAAASWAWVELASRGARLEVAPCPATVVEDEPYPVRVDVRGGWVPLRAELRHALLPGPLAVGISRPGQVEHVRVEARFPRRGRRSAGRVTLQVTDPLHLHRRELARRSAEVLVLPRVEPVRQPADGGGARGEGALDRFVWGAGGLGLDASAIDVEIDGVRPYRDGSPASRIHWPTVARSRELLERRLVAGGSEAPVVVLDAANPSSGEALDCAVRAAASLCLHLAMRGGCTLLLAGDRHPQRIDRQLRAWPAAHARMALVEAGAAAPALARSVTGSLFWVTAGTGGLAIARHGARSACLVTPNPLRGRPAVFEVAGCHGQLLGGSRATTAGARSAA
jgi:uncharacterized protein (DUF58 family)